MSRKRREFVRVLHSNAEGQPRSKIKPSKKKGKKWEILPGDPCDSRDIDPTGDRPYRYRPRGHVGCTTGEIKGFLRSACGTMCAENFHVGFHYIYSENTGRPDGRQTGWSASLCERYAGKGLSRLFPVVHCGGLSLRHLLSSPYRERRERRSEYFAEIKQSHSASVFIYMSLIQDFLF